MRFQRRIFFIAFVTMKSIASWQPGFFDSSNLLSYFCRGSPREHSCEVWLKLAQFYKMSFYLKQIVEDEQSITLTDPKS